MSNPQEWTPPASDDLNWSPPASDDLNWKPPASDAVTSQKTAAPPKDAFNWRDPNTWLPALWRNETEGVGQAVQGGKKIWSGVTGAAPEGAGRAIAGGLHGVISGAGQVIAPAALPAAAIAGLPEAALGMAGGAAAGWLAKKGAAALNLAPEYQNLAGDVGNIAGGSIAGGLTPRPKLAS